MLNLDSVLKPNQRPVPKVLLDAKKEAVIQALKKKTLGKSRYDKGPWDDGHWANRK